MKPVRSLHSPTLLWAAGAARQEHCAGEEMAPTKIMIIRHAEKPDQNGGVLGIDEAGRPDPNQLSVRGWQRTGALVPFFASAGQEDREAIATPSAIFA